MLYLERRPHPTLAPFIKSFWYACDPEATHRHERVLPKGHPQIVISLARDYLTDANHPTDPLQHTPAALLLGIYSHHQQIDTIDLSELIGILFHPGGARPFSPDNTDLFTNCETDLTTRWAELHKTSATTSAKPHPLLRHPPPLAQPHLPGLAPHPGAP
jgi:hypothetical protein